MTAYAINHVNLHAIQDSPFRNQVIVERKLSASEISNSTNEKLYSLLKTKIASYSEQNRVLLNNKDGLLKKVIYPSSMIKEDIKDSIHTMFGYKINEIDESLLADDEDTFTVYTVVLDLPNKDYSKLIDEEWEISESLGLYEKNIILRFI